jgi:hypothetical protein
MVLFHNWRYFHYKLVLKAFEEVKRGGIGVDVKTGDAEGVEKLAE